MRLTHKSILSMMSDLGETKNMSNAQVRELASNVTGELVAKHTDDLFDVMVALRMLSNNLRDKGDLRFADAIDSEIDELREIEFQLKKQIA